MLELIIGLVIGLIAGTFGGMYLIKGVAKETIEEYKERWQKALELLNADGKIDDKQLKQLRGIKGETAQADEVNGWKIETYQTTGVYKRDGKELKSVPCVAIRLVKNGQIMRVPVNENNSVGLDPAVESNFPEAMRQYRLKAEQVAESLN